MSIILESYNLTKTDNLKLALFDDETYKRYTIELMDPFGHKILKWVSKNNWNFTAPYLLRLKDRMLLFFPATKKQFDLMNSHENLFFDAPHLETLCSQNYIEDHKE